MLAKLVVKAVDCDIKLYCFFFKVTWIGMPNFFLEKKNIQKYFRKVGFSETSEHSFATTLLETVKKKPLFLKSDFHLILRS